MENKYNHEAGKRVLKERIDNFLQGNNNKSCNHLSLFKTAGYQVEEIKKPTIYRLTISGENASEREEAVFVVHGILIDKDLPPVIVTNQTRNDQGRIQKFAAIARQYIALTGLNLDLFDDALEGLARVHRFFEDSLPPNSIESFQLPTIEGSSVLASHTRYFTPRRNSLSLILENFGPGVDPNGVLEYLKGSNFVHTEDNVVQYLGEKESKNGTSYYNINPISFQRGDIVEIAVSFFCIPTRMKKFKMITSLKTIVLLDDTIREKARSDATKSQLNTNATKVHFKRRFIPTDGEGVPARKHARMDTT